MDLDTLQAKVARAWSNQSYSVDFQIAADRLPHLAAAHAAGHLVKAAAKVLAAIEPADHGGEIDRFALANALADVVICACGVANKLPHAAVEMGPAIDLGDATHRRFNEISGRQSPLDHQS